MPSKTDVMGVNDWGLKWLYVLFKPLRTIDTTAVWRLSSKFFVTNVFNGLAPIRTVRPFRFRKSGFWKNCGESAVSPLSVPEVQRFFCPLCPRFRIVLQKP